MKELIIGNISKSTDAYIVRFDCLVKLCISAIIELIKISKYDEGTGRQDQQKQQNWRKYIDRAWLANLWATRDSDID